MPIKAAVAAIGNIHIENEDKDPVRVPDMNSFALLIAAAYTTTVAATTANNWAGNKLVTVVTSDRHETRNKIFKENWSFIDIFDLSGLVVVFFSLSKECGDTSSRQVTYSGE